jgi:hypothetical protein
MQAGTYNLDINDFLWTLRDILRTAGMILFFNCIKNHFPHHKTGNIKKKMPKKLNKKIKK